MLLHGNRLLADDSHKISYLIFVENSEKSRKNVSSAEVLIGTLRVKTKWFLHWHDWDTMSGLSLSQTEYVFRYALKLLTLFLTCFVFFTLLLSSAKF